MLRAELCAVLLAEGRQPFDERVRVGRIVTSHGPAPVPLPDGSAAAGRIPARLVLDPVKFVRLNAVTNDGFLRYAKTAVELAIGLIGIAIAHHLYVSHRGASERIYHGRGRLIAHALERRFYWDDLYRWTFERPVQWAASFLDRGVDRTAFRWAPLDGVGQLTAFLGRSFAVIENGIVRMYALVLALGIGGLILYLLVRGG